MNFFGIIGHMPLLFHSRRSLVACNLSTQGLFPFLRFLCCVLLLGLYGCHAKNTLRAQEFAQCNSICIQHLDFCKQNCTDNCSTCSQKSLYSSTMNYKKYVNEQKIEGQRVMRELNSYRDPLQCRKVTCNCQADFLACKQSCTRVIPKRLQAVPNCI